MTSSVEHPLSANDVQDKLMNSSHFRLRLNLKMGDENVVADGHNITFVPKIPEIGAKVRLFQNSDVKWAGNTIVIISHFVFTIRSALVKVGSTRAITRVSSSTCRSHVDVKLCENQLDDRIGKIACKYILQRHKEEDNLLTLSQSSQLALPNSIAVPYDTAFAGFRDTLERIDRFLQDESSIDPSVLATRRELEELHSEISEATTRIQGAIHTRTQMQSELHHESERVARAAGAIQTALAEPMRQAESVDSNKNDVAFAVSLIPLAVAVFGMVMDSRRK